MTPYGYREQQILADGTYLSNMPPRIPLLKGLGIADGSRILRDRRADWLEDETKYPPGSILKVMNRRVSESGLEYCDVKVDYYRLMGVEEKLSFWLGTDQMGRDIWTRLWRGTRTTLMIALLAAAVELAFGILYGAVAGYFGKTTDLLMMRLCEIIRALPGVVTASLLIMALGSGAFSMILALALRGWVGIAQLTRAQVLRCREQEFVLASRTMGASHGRLIFRHILPNSWGSLITAGLLAIPSAVFTESFLAYIGLGIPAPESSLGTLLSGAWPVLDLYPYQTLFPALVLSLLMGAFTMLAGSLRRALDPNGRGQSPA